MRATTMILIMVSAMVATACDETRRFCVCGPGDSSLRDASALAGDHTGDDAGNAQAVTDSSSDDAARGGLEPSTGNLFDAAPPDDIGFADAGRDSG